MILFASTNQDVTKKPHFDGYASDHSQVLEAALLLDIIRNKEPHERKGSVQEPT
jgi:hypothetical protein